MSPSEWAERRYEAPPPVPAPGYIGPYPSVHRSRMRRSSRRGGIGAGNGYVASEGVTENGTHVTTRVVFASSVRVSCRGRRPRTSIPSLSSPCTTLDGISASGSTPAPATSRSRPRWRARRRKYSVAMTLLAEPWRHTKSTVRVGVMVGFPLALSTTVWRHLRGAHARNLVSAIHGLRRAPPAGGGPDLLLPAQTSAPQTRRAGR